jgi:hypothetical protein
MTDELLEILNKAKITNVGKAQEYLVESLKRLQQSGAIELEPDHNLSGISLELRVQQIFKNSGFDIKEGRPRMEDFVITPKEDFENRDPIVVEVKSSRAPQLSLDDLRQLDDWVFDLSGEEKARKSGLGGGLDSLAIATNGYVSRPRRHPTPHKGLLIFNAPVGLPFTERSPQVLHPNQTEFAMKRNFCVIAINELVDLVNDDPKKVWTILHETIGEYTKNAE